MKKLFLFLFIILFAISAYAGEVANITLVWDANNEQDLEGYYLYTSKTSNLYTEAGIEITSGETYTLQLEDPNGTYYFVVTAYDTAGNESDYSNEVLWETPEPPEIDTNAPVNPKNLKITVSVIVEMED